MSKTKTYEFADCHHKIVVNGQELQCLLREGHAGDCMSQYWWKPNAAQQSVQSDVACTCALTKTGWVAVYDSECPDPYHRHAADASRWADCSTERQP